MFQVSQRVRRSEDRICCSAWHTYLLHQNKSIIEDSLEIKSNKGRDTMVLYCPNCGKQIQDETASFCLSCGKPLKEITYKKTAFPIAAGIMTILAACISVPIGVLFLGVYIQQSIYWGFRGYDLELFVIGFVSILGFAFGLASGITSIKRKHFGLAIAGLILVMLSGLVIIFGMAVRGYSTSLTDGLTFGVPIIGLAILSLIFVAISNQEFS
jgi:hypothetical protein